MFLACLRKELLHNILSLRYALIFLLFLSLTVAVTAVRTRIYTRQVADHTQAVHELNAVSHMVRHALQSNALGTTVEPAPNPMAIFAAGLESEMTRAFWIRLGSTRSRDESTTVRLGLRKLNNYSFRYPYTVDIVLVVNLLCSLLAIALVFDAVSGERERGTLKVALAGPLPRDTVIISKLVSGLLTLLSPLVLSWVLCVLYVMYVGTVPIGAEELVRLGAIVVLSVLYLSFFFAMGMAATCWLRGSATVLGVCLLLWVFFVLAVPTLVPAVVHFLAPVPAESKIVLEKDAVTRSMWSNEVDSMEFELAESDVFENDGTYWFELVRRARLEQTRRFDKIDRYYAGCVQRQLRLTPAVSRLSPSAAFVYAASHCAGTGAQDFTRLLKDVQDYIRAYGEKREELEKVRLAEKRRREEAKEPGPWHDAYDPDAFPAFSRHRLDLPSVINHCWVDAVMLLGGTVLLFLISFVGFMRYDVQ
ncbi:MAG: ABC transporter permease subunit [Chitinivibrionales bacterium]|nr:ABC transporter permease subunit [Chitinivibrionales bacterium]